jgi:signal transduction histidine kinase
MVEGAAMPQFPLIEKARLTMPTQIARVLFHEFNNFLNGLLLHLAVMEKERPESSPGNLAEVQRQAREMSDLLKQWGQIRSSQANGLSGVNLNEILHETAAEVCRELTAHGRRATLQSANTPGNVVLNLDPKLRLAAALPLDITQICILLVKNSVSAMTGDGTVTLLTEQTPSHILLRVENPTTACPPEHVTRLFDCVDNGAATGYNMLEMAVCKNLLRRCRGKIRAENRPGGGLLITVDLPEFSPAV